MFDKKSKKPDPTPTADPKPAPAVVAPSAPSCGSCAHGLFPKAEALGHCRRFPPERSGEFPTVSAALLCGEFKPR